MGDYSFVGLARSVIEQSLADVHTCLPARVIEVTADQQKATVQPMIKARYTDADGSDLGLKDMATIPNVQLVFMGSKHATMTFPVAKGDLVWLFFSERSLDNFSYSDGSSPVDPADLRMHDYNDAFALCGGFTFPTALGMHPEDTVIRMNAGQSNETKVSLKPNGDIVADSSAKFIVNTQSDTVINSSGVVHVTSSGTTTIDASSATVNCNTTINGNLTLNGNATISGTSTATDHMSSGKSGRYHTHMVPFVKAGTDTTYSNSPI